MGSTKEEKKKKPFEKMTSKELREIASELSEITGMHGMNKPELLSAIKKAKGITENIKKTSSASIREIKKKIKELKIKHTTTLEAQDEKIAGILRRKITRLKKKTRRAG